MSLDDLFDREPPPAAASGLRRQLRWLVRAVAGSLLIGGAAVAMLLIFDRRLWYPAVLLAAFAAAMVFRAAFILPIERTSGRAGRQSEPPRHDGRAPEVRRWYASLRDSRRRPARGVLRQPLAGLVDERLRQRHGCTRASSPERARQLLGPALWTYLAVPDRRDPDPAELAAILTTVEEM